MAEGNQRRTDPPDFSETAPVAVGIGIWALLFVIGLVIRQNLQDSGRGWWIWTAAAGVVLGLIGYLYLLRRRARLLAVSNPVRPGSQPGQSVQSDQPGSQPGQPENA